MQRSKNNIDYGTWVMPFNSNKGFSLVEVLVSAAVLSIVLLGINRFFADSSDDLTVKETREKVAQNLGYMHSSVKKVSNRMVSKPAMVTCMKGGGKCLSVLNQDPSDMSDIKFQFGTTCKDIGSFAKTMNNVRKNVTASISKNIQKDCSISCSGSKIPAAVMYMRKGTGSPKETFFPNSYAGNLSSMVASGICVKSIDPLSVKLKFVGFYLNKQNKFAPSKLAREFVVPTTSFTNSLQILK
jgi:prepilin-type N-terminal cleavage/methylation domain-containing protein